MNDQQVVFGRLEIETLPSGMAAMGPSWEDGYEQGANDALAFVQTFVASIQGELESARRTVDIYAGRIVFLVEALQLNLGLAASGAIIDAMIEGEQKGKRDEC